MVTQFAQKHSLVLGLERFSRETAAGYDRHIIDDSRIVLVGCGALGQFVALLLALIGYPDVIFVDMDTFEESNMTRSPFYRKDMGKAFATATGARALCTATGTTQYRYASKMVQWLGDALFHADKPVVLISAVDTVRARWWLAERALLNSVPLLEGGFKAERWNLSVTLNRNPNDACWACDQPVGSTSRLFSCAAYAKTVSASGMIPAMATTSALLAARMVEAATMLLHHKADLAQCTVFGNTRTTDTQLMRRVRNPDCRCDHELTTRDAAPIAVEPAATVRELIREVEDIIKEPIVQLPASFIVAAPCVKCHGSVSVNKPEWAISEPPICIECGGTYPCGSDQLPEQHGSVSKATSESVLDMSLVTLGIGPGLHLNVSGCDRQALIRIGGTLDSSVTPVVADSR